MNDTITKSDIKIGIMLPKIISMMTGVSTIHVYLDGVAELIYTDHTTEKGKLSDETMVQVLKWQEYQLGLGSAVSDINVMDIVSQVQSQRGESK